MRVLGRIRLSHSTEESTSAERQRELIQDWADRNDHTVVGWAEDIDVSGSIDPFKTPELGEWLTPENMGEFDILCAWKMDRLARNTVALHKLMGWCMEHNKALVCVSDSIDLSTWTGRMVAGVIAGVAEGELEAIRERNRASRKKLTQLGRVTGARYGYRIVNTPEGKKWEPDPETSEVIRWMAKEVLAGTSVKNIIDQLEERGVKSPTGKARWSHTSVRSVLTKKSLLGWSIYHGEPVLDSEGNPLVIAEPILDTETFNRLAEVFEARKRHRNYKTNHNVVLGVAQCAECKTNLVRLERPSRTSEAPRLGCNTCRKSYREDYVVPHIHRLFRDYVAEHDEVERVVHAPVDNREEIASTERAISELVQVIAGGDLSEGTRSIVSNRLTALDKQLESLKERQRLETTVEWRKTGRRYADVWDSLDDMGKREMMKRAGVVFYVGRANMGGHSVIDIEAHVPAEFEELLRK